METLDDQIRPLYEAGSGCRAIGKTLGENPAIVFKRVKRMGIIRSSQEARVLAPEESLPFNRTPDRTGLRRSGAALAIHWFMDRDYMVSLPVEPARYDLVVESGQGLKKIQIKTTTQKDRGKWVAQLSRKAYDSSLEPNAGGKTRRLAYTPEEVDFFFIITGDRSCYLIPIGVVEGQFGATLDHKYKRYRV